MTNNTKLYKMKHTIYSVIGLLTFAMTFFACVKDTDYKTPKIEFENPNLTGNNVSLANVIETWQTNIKKEPVKIFDNDYPDYISVYVTSSDETGNFYKELFVQDSLKDPTSAIKISIDMKSLYTKYDRGRKVHIYLKGLGIGKTKSGEIVLSEIENGSLSRYISQGTVKTNFVKDPEKAAVTPLTVSSPAAIDNSYLNKYVKFDNIMFALDLMGKNFTDSKQDFDTKRLLTACADNSVIQLETSSFAKFKNAPLPEGMGSVEGIITRDYTNKFYVLIVNSDKAFSFNHKRCDPEIIDCGLAQAQGKTNLLKEDFESQTPRQSIAIKGWTNYIEKGSRDWKTFSSSKGNLSLGVSAIMGSFKSGDKQSIAWLITPQINLDNQEGETLMFKTSNSFSDGSNLELLYSSDWDGNTANISSATWGIIPKAYIVKDSDNYADWKSSGIVDLSCVKGKIYIAFKYTGSGNQESDGTYELDDISIDY